MNGRLLLYFVLAWLVLLGIAIETKLSVLRLVLPLLVGLFVFYLFYATLILLFRTPLTDIRDDSNDETQQVTQVPKESEDGTKPATTGREPDQTDPQ